MSQVLLTVVIPAFNESPTINQVVSRVLNAPYEKQVIAVDDGSTDDTLNKLLMWKDDPRVEVLSFPLNRGKGTAIRTALTRARGEYIIIQDADLEYDPTEYDRVIGPLLSGTAQIVYGSRYCSGSVKHWDAFRLGVIVLNACVKLIYGATVTDEATCYKAMATETLRQMDLECERFDFCPEVTAKACRMGLAITDVAISYKPRTVSAGKKIRLADGLDALYTLWKWRRWRPGSRTTQP